MIKSFLLYTGYLFLLTPVFSQTARDSFAISGYNIIRYGAKADGKTNNTTAIQQAVNECHRNGGGKIIIPPGIFITGTIHLYSNMEIELESGSELLGCSDDKDYLYQKDFGFTGPGAGTRTGIFVAHNEQNISITGSGTINGNGTFSMYMDSLQKGDNLNAKFTRQGSEYMNPKYGREDGPVMWKGSYDNRPGVMIIFSSCKNIRLTNINLKESPNWTIAFINSEDIKVSGITIDNNMNIPNSDGIDFYDSKNITISDCVIQAGDDAIAVISSSNITATNCILHSRSCGIRVGYNVFNNNNSGDLLFNNIRIYDSNRGIGIFQRRRGNMENMIFSNIIIGTRLHSGQWWGHGEPIHISSIPGLGTKETGTISNLRFSNITATSETGIVIYGSGEGQIRDIYFENINLTINKSPLEEGYGGNIDLRPVNDIALGIFSHDIPALYSTYADNLDIRNMHVNWGAGLPAYFKHDVDCANFNTLTIDGLHEEIPENSPVENSSIVFLHKGGITHIRELSSTDKKRKFILKSEND
jgi:Glycosyl hydrolases family 28